MKRTYKRTILAAETAIEWFKENRYVAKFYCDLHTDYTQQFEDGSWNKEPPTDRQLNQAAEWFVENHFGIDGHIATDEELDAISDGTARLV